MSTPTRDADTTESDSNLDDTAGEGGDGGDNSILGKVKSRVTRIFPNSFSKWFSPSTRYNNDSQNGSLNTSNISGSSRRRRRIEIEAEEDEDELLVEEPEDTEQQVRRQCKYKNTDEDQADQDESDNSDEDNIDARTPPSISVPTIRPRRSINTTEQPPVKKKRLELNETNLRDDLVSNERFVASTPAVSSQLRGTSNNSQFSRGNVNRFKHLNLSQSYKSEQPYNFAAHIDSAVTKTSSNNAANIIGLVKNQNINSETEPINEYVSSRRNLNIPTTILPNHKRAALSSVLDDLPSTSCGISYNLMTRRTLTTTHEIADKDFNRQSTEPISIEQEETVESGETTRKNNITTKYNGRAQNSQNFTNKRQKIINGGHTEDQDVNIETASESSDGSGSMLQRKTGLFNNANSSRTASRTSSIGNGLNFFTHLEGRKSLFAGPHAGNEIQGLNNSTLSLTSLNRRQFNASIYGSTSALSDSRLLNSVNTASPFYNGRTTYGGAAAYNKYSLTGAGASASCLTPTIIRPTSSLSTLSSSNASMGTNAAGLVSNLREHPHLSNTAKSILNLLNDSSTPLNEARKMANNLRPNQQPLTPQLRNRLNETNLEATRTMRLSQVPKPYMRSVVTLQPTQLNGTGKNIKNILPPVRELQVPSMSQLLQMKKIQSSTERSRQIASISNLQSGQTQEYTLPIREDLTDGENKIVQKKHTSKIKSKLSTVARVTGSKHHEIEDRPPSPVNLPNIAFPLMQSMPKIDIQLPSAAKISNESKNISTIGVPATSFSINTSGAATITQSTNTNLSKPMFAFNNNHESQKNTMSTNSINTDVIKSNNIVNAANNVNFKFSSPLAVQNCGPILPMTTKINNYKFSPPTTIVDLSAAKDKSIVLKETAINTPFAATTQSPVTQLKTGSVLEALKVNDSTVNNNAFGSQFMKSSSEWECDTCMIRNRYENSKCVACETPRKSSSNSTAPMMKSTTNSIQATNSFGSQFKKSANEWECDACMIQNKQSDTKCIACETPKKDDTGTNNNNSTKTLPLIKNTFGDSFKPKGNTWECPTCLINNNSDANECVACQTKNPKAKTDSNKIATAPVSAFKFGFTTDQTVTPVNTDKATQDSGFKSIVAQQKASSWECEACMTRNDATRNKCICCEQAKPGTQITSETTPKFSFGTSAATKFSFGFPSTTNSSSTPAKSPVKDKTEETSSTFKASNSNTVGSVTSTSGSTATTAQFTFGLMPTSNPSTTKNDTGDSSKKSPLSGFKFGASDKTFSSSPITAATTTSTTLTNTSGFTFDQGSKIETSKTLSTTSTTIATNTTPSVTFKLPATTLGTAIEPIKPAFEGGFAFGAPSQKTEASKTTSSATTADFAFKVPQTPANTNPTTSTATMATATVIDKPTFSFGVHNSLATTASSITSTTAALATTASGFSFGSNTKTTVPAATNKSLFGIVSSSSTTSLTTTAPANNIFGQINNTSNTTTSVTSTTSTFGSYTAVSSGKNAFGSFGQNAVEAKPNLNAAPMFGSTNSGTVPTNAAIPFLFGESTAVSTAVTTNTTNSTITTAPSWSKNSFVFGSGSGVGGSSSGSSSSSAATITNANAEGNKSTLFGSFGTNNSSSTGANIVGTLKSTESAPPTFGSVTAAPAFGSATTAPAFGSSLTSSINSSNNFFGTNTTPGLGTTNIFGTSASGNATTPQVPAFGAAPAFGGSASTSSVTPTFGSTAASAGTTFGNSSALSATPTFGSFSAAAAAATATTATTTQDATTKKAEPFKFGDVNNQNTAGVFNFGSNVATPKPAFNFSATTTIQPSFNFSGSSEPPQMLQQQQTQQIKPFQFGAVTPTPVFNFSGGAVEATPNAPFQFNAGTAPATNNIFAPAPAPGTPTPQQPRRKIRAPIRRLTPR